MVTVAEVFEGMRGRFDADAAAGKNIVFQFDITNEQPYYITVNDGDLESSEGKNDDDSVTLIMNSNTFVGIMTGGLDGMQAYMTSKLKTQGNMMLAAKLSEFFKQ